jgi:hypothetical protein
VAATDMDSITISDGLIQDPYNIAGDYVRHVISDANIEGVWTSSVSTVQENGFCYLSFSNFDGKNKTSSSAKFSDQDDIDFSIIESYYAHSTEAVKEKYIKLDGKIELPGMCFMPVFLSDDYVLLGVSDSKQELPKYWYTSYRIG